MTQGRAGHIRGRRRRPRPLDSRNGRGSEPTGRFQKGCPVTLLRRKASPREEAGKGKGLQGPSLGGGPCRGPGSGTFSRGSHPGVCTRPRASRGTELYEAAPWGPQLSRQRSDRNRAWLLRSVGVGAPQRRSAGWARGSPLLGGETQGIQAFISQRSASDCPVSPRQTDVSTPGPEHPGGLQPSSSGGTKGGLPRSQAIQPGAACIRPSGPRRC